MKKIYIHADGGNWIKNGLEEYAQMVHVMDGFHFERDLKRIANLFQGKLSVTRIYLKNGGKLTSKDMEQVEGERTEGYWNYAEQMLSETMEGTSNWSIFSQREMISFDQASGTQQLIHQLGSYHNILN